MFEVNHRYYVRQSKYATISPIKIISKSQKVYTVYHPISKATTFEEIEQFEEEEEIVEDLGLELPDSDNKKIPSPFDDYQWEKITYTTFCKCGSTTKTTPYWSYLYIPHGSTCPCASKINTHGTSCSNGYDVTKDTNPFCKHTLTGRA